MTTHTDTGPITAPPTLDTARANPRRVESRDPATGLVWRDYEAASATDVTRTVAAARRAQLAWGATPVRERARVLEHFRRALFARRREVAELICRENGKPPSEAMGTEVMLVLDFARFYRDRAPRLLRDRSLTPFNAAFWRKRVHITHEPFGVVGIISPWNYPFMLASAQVLAALVSGNAVVLKPSEFTPATGLMIGDLMRDAGLPDGVLHIVTGNGSAGAALVSSEIDKLFFTGSNATGLKVSRACAERMIPCVLELGGSDPAIVLEDADIAHAVSGIAWGRFSNAGQTCVAPKRVFVVGEAHDAFVAKLAEVVKALKMGAGSAPGTDVGPMIRPQQRAVLEAQLEDALAHGAYIAARTPVGGADGDGFFAPAILTDVTNDMRVMREETFGPLLPVVRVRDADEAVQMANATPYGLSASVWGRDVRRARAVAARLASGSVTINDSIVQAGIAEAPHGGIKQSGTGRSHGEAGLLECVQTKTLIVDLLPGRREP
ncbi:MAG: aldehyde dehydrogenase family protein, partial [Gemmatimonadota bacterium]|nr:aldehyde dehydrogenase family protein [Gemmatimonadota bacterium]